MPDYAALVDRLPSGAGDDGGTLATGANTSELNPSSDQSLNAATPAIAPGAPAAPVNRYSAIIDNADALKAQQAKAVTAQAHDADPDVAAKAAALAPHVGVPAQAVESDLPAFQKQVEAAQNAQLIDSTPALASWVAANPDSARIAKDDFGKLSTIAKAVTALKIGATSAIAGNALGRAYGNKAVDTDLGLYTGKDQSDIEANEAALAAQPKLSGAYGAIAGGASFFTALVDNFLQGQKVAAVAGGAGALVGAAAGGVGAIPGAAAGYTYGSGVGFLGDMARVAAGENYRATGQILDKSGAPLSEASRQIAAGLVGVGTYAAAGLGGKVVGGVASDTIGKFMGDAATEAITRPTVQRAIGIAAGNVAKGAATGAGVMGLMEATSVAGEEIAKQLSTGNFDTVFNDPLRRQEALGRVADAMEIGALTVGLLHVPGAALDVAGGAARARQAASDADNLQSVMTGAADSKTRGRSLDAFHSFLASQAKGSSVENLFVAGGRVRELYQSMGIEPGPEDPIFGKVAPDIADQLRQSEETGGDVVLPMADYVTHLAGTPVADALKPDIRVRADGWSLREVEDYQNRDPQEIADQVAGAADQQEHEIAAAAPARAVYDDMFSKLRAAGYTVDAARQNAQLMAARYQTRAERLGGTQGDAKALYDAEGVDVKRVLPSSLEHVPVDESDMVINALRNGSKLPSDRELFGPSLVEAIKERGGITDPGGELKAMDAPKGLIRKIDDTAPAIGDMVGGRVASTDRYDYSAEAVAQAMHERGYFPDHGEPPEPDDLHAAIDAELRGDPVYMLGSTDERRAGFKAAVADLDRFLNEQGIDADKATNAEIKAALKDYQARALDDRSFEQAPAQLSDIEADAKAAGVELSVSETADRITVSKIVVAKDERSAGKGSAVMHSLVDYADATGRDVVLTASGDFGGAVGRLKAFYKRFGFVENKGKNKDFSTQEGMIRKARPREFEQAAFHGSPYKFDKFSLDHMGKGEGAQAFGWGLYFAGNKEVAKYYREGLSPDPTKISVDGKEVDVSSKSKIPAIERRAILMIANNGGVDAAIEMARHEVKAHTLDPRPASKLIEAIEALREAKIESEESGRLYHVELAPKEDEYLDWDKPLSEQSEIVQKALGELISEQQIADRLKYGKGYGQFVDTKYDKGADAYEELSRILKPEPPRKSIAGMLGWTTVEPTHYADPRAASLALLDKGVRGIRYSDGGSRGTEGGTHNYVIFDDADVAIREYEQSERGKISLSNGRAMISLFKGSDLSTFLHESGHLFLDEMIRDGRSEGAPAQLGEDLAAILKFLKVKSADEIGTEQHEAFARAFETYLMEGKAPSSALATAFRKFKSWLVTIYRELKNLNSPISDNMRDVFDRLLASDDEIAAVRAKENLNPIFKSAADAGMTNAEWDAYNKQLALAANAGDERMLKAAMVAIRAERTREYKDQAAEMRDSIEGEVRSRQDLRAQYWLRTGRLLDDPDAEPAANKVRLSRVALADMYASDEAPGLLPKGVFANKGGAHPDDVAPLFGYGDGDALVKALMNLESARRAEVARSGKGLDGAQYLAHLIDSEVQARLFERHGDPLSDGSIEQEALAAVHNAAQADAMAAELRVLYRRAGAGDQPPLSLADIKAWVEGALFDMPIERGSDDRAFARQEAKAGRAVERALLKGDYREAFQQRQRQLVNHLMTIRAAEIKTEYERGKKLFRRLAQSLTIDTVDQGYLDQMHALLHRYGYSLKRDPAELLRGLKGEGLEAFVDRKFTEGVEPVVASILLDAKRDAPVDSLTVDHFMALKDAIDSLRYLGRDAQSMVIEGKRIQTRDIREAIVDRLDLQKQKGTSEYYAPADAGALRGAAHSMIAMLKGADASLLKQEQVFDWIDGGDPDGPMNRYVFRRLKEAQHWENDRRSEIAEHFKGLMRELGKDWQKGLKGFVPDKSLPQADGTPYKFTRKRMLALALNVGNDGNFSRLVDGHGWSRDRVMDYLNRNMTEADWRFTQSIWDMFESLRPEIDALQRRVTGIGISFVKAAPFDTKFGGMRGGYYPIVYDPERSYMAERHSEKATTDSLLQNQYLRATPPQGHTKTRVENVKAPLNLDLDVIPWKIGQTLHDLAFREAVMDADKILSDKAVMGAVDKTFGAEYRKQFRPWLQDIANSRNINDAALGWLDKALKTARTNFTMVGIGFRFSTIFKHGSTALSNSVGELGVEYMRKGLAEFLGTPAQMKRKWEFVTSESAEMRNRMDSYDRDVRENLKTLLGESGLKAQVQRYGHYGVATADMMSAIPTWLGAYAKARDGGAEHGDAVYAADKLVRKAHGAQAIVDLAAIQRVKSEPLKMATMFYGFFNHIYNRQRNAVHVASRIPDQLRAGDYVGAKRDFAHVLAMSFYYLAIPALVEAYYSHGAPGDGEGWGEWGGKAIASEIPAGLPILRDIAKSAIEGHDFSYSPLEQAVRTITGTTHDIAKRFGWEEGEPSGRWLQHAVETAGYASGWPTGQAGSTGQYLWDVGSGDANPQSIGDFTHGLVYGRQSKPK